MHQDWVAIAFNAVRVTAACSLAALIGICSGLPATAQVLTYTAIYVSLGTVLPNPTTMGKAALYGMPAVAVAGAAYSFFVFPLITGYPLFILSLLPLVVAMCWLMMICMPGAGLIFGVQTLILISPANVQTLDPPTFVDAATMFVVSGISIMLAFLLVLPVNSAARRLRLVLSTARALRRALAKREWHGPLRTTVHYDRLAQLKTWQGKTAPTPARAKTMKRLVGIGSLSFAVRRAWLGLDRARPYVDHALDVRARQAVPRLATDETFAIAADYLRAATGKIGEPALAAAFAAAALYGTGLAPRAETALLGRIGLVGRVS